MDDDRLARAREGDLDAFLDLVRPRLGRLIRLAAIAAGDPATARRAATGAIRRSWRDVRRLAGPQQLDAALERGLVAGLPRRRRGAAGAHPADPLDRALRPLAPAARVAMARCLDPQPDPEALAVAGRAGAEVGTGAPTGAAALEASLPTGEIVDLDGPLVGWDLGRLRSALVAAAGIGAPGHPDDLLEELRADLTGIRPDAGLLVAFRSVAPGPAALTRGAALALVAVAGIATLLAVAPGSTAPAADGPAGAAPTAAPDRGSGGSGVAGNGGGSAGSGSPGDVAADTAGDFPDVVDGLAVIGVREARSLARDPAAAERALAIRGWLSPPELRGACQVPSAAAAGGVVADDGAGAAPPAPMVVDQPLDSAAAFCHRQAVLREDPGATWGVAHLHPQLLPGTGLGRARRIFAGRDEPLPVVVIAHFGDPRAGSCATGGRHCGEELVVDKIAWVLGAPARSPVAVHPAQPADDTVRSGHDAMAIAREAYAGVRAVAASGAPAAEIGLVEPAAAGLTPGAGFAWLVRAIVEPRPGDRAGALRTWLVVDDRTGAVVAAPDAATASASAPGDDAGGEAAAADASGFLFPRRAEGVMVRTVAEARALAEAGLPEGSVFAVAGWLATPTLAGACLAGARDAEGPLSDGAAFCRRGTTLRGPTPDGRGLSLQLPPGTPAPPIEDAVDGRRMPVPVVALVEAGSLRSEPCWPTDNGCGRELALERLLWVDGSATEVAVAELDGAGLARPRLSVAEVRALAEEAVGDLGRLVSIVRVPADRRGDVAPGSERRPLAGEHAWVVRVRGPLAGTTAHRASVEQLSWLLVDDATGRAQSGASVLGDPDEPPPATPPG